MSSQIRTIGVHGEGSVTIVPDLAYLVFGVEMTDVDLARARRANATRMAAVLAALKALGVAETDLRTSGYQVRQEYSHPEQRPAGYHVSNTILATVRDLTTLGDAIDAAVGAGANRIQSVRLDLADKADALRRAREAAVADARDKAEQHARLSGMRLGMPLAIVESGGHSPPSHAVYDAPPFARRLAAPAHPTPIEAGESLISLLVQITYEIGEVQSTAD